MRYTLFLASDEGNVKAGWGSCRNFITEIVTMGKLRGWEDPREGARNQFLWNRFRRNFTSQVQVARKSPQKLRLTPAHLQAIVTTLNLDEFNDLKWATAFVTLWHSNARVGHVAPKSKTHTDHVWKFEDLVFSPSLANATAVVVHFRSSKTRAAAEDRTFWTALGKVDLQEGQPNTCPVRLLKMWVQRAYRGHPTHPLFGSREDPSVPIVRDAFTRTLRTCLTEGARHLAPPHNTLNPKSFSGISFRKGSLSAMSGVVEFNRLRERADHKHAESTSHYVVDSVQTRAQSSADVHTRFGGAHTHASRSAGTSRLSILPVWHNSSAPEGTSPQVMITVGAQTMHPRRRAGEQAEDQLRHVTIKHTAQGESKSIFARLRQALGEILPSASARHAWTNSERAVEEWLSHQLSASDVSLAGQAGEDAVVAVNFADTSIANLFRAIVATESEPSREGSTQRRAAGKDIRRMPTWATAAYLNACELSADGTRQDVKAWRTALQAASKWAQVPKARNQR